MREMWDKAIQAQIRRAAANRRSKKDTTLPLISVGDLVLVAETVKPDQVLDIDDHTMDMATPGPGGSIPLRIQGVGHATGEELAEGYDAAHDTDEPVSNLAVDVPDMVEAYLTTNSKDKKCVTLLCHYFS